MVEAQYVALRIDSFQTYTAMKSYMGIKILNFFIMKKNISTFLFICLFSVIGDGCVKIGADDKEWCAECSSNIRPSDSFCGPSKNVDDWIKNYKAQVVSRGGTANCNKHQ